MTKDHQDTLEQLYDVVDEWLHFPHIRGANRLQQEAEALCQKIERYRMDELYEKIDPTPLLEQWSSERN